MKTKSLIVLLSAFAFICFLNDPVDAKIDPETVVGVWPFDEGEGNEVEDSSGNEHTGLGFNGDLEWAEGKFGSAISVGPNAGASVNVDHNERLDLDTFTIMAWVKFNSVDNSMFIAVKQRRAKRRNFLLAANRKNFRLAFTSDGADEDGLVRTATAPSENT